MLNKICPVCSGTGICPVCGNYQENRMKEIKNIIQNIENEIYDMTHERGKRGMKHIPKRVMLESIDKVKHVSSLKFILANLKEVVK